VFELTRIENRNCPLRKATCTGRLCAFTSWKAKTMILTSGASGSPGTEWICDMTDRVVETT
jgi:hypothetical protein